MTHAQTSEYWISPTAINITLNAMGDPNKTLGSTAAGAMVMCYVPSVDGVIGTYDNGHSYRRWSLQAYNTAFGDDDKKYVYIAIPRSVTDTNALVVFPSVEIDIYGISHSAKKDSEGNIVYVPEYEEDGTTVKTDESGNPIYTTTPVDDPKQIGSTNYYYIYLHAIISATNGTTLRTWLNEDGTASDTCSVNTGSLSTDAAIASAIATIDDLLRGMFTPVDDALNPVTNLTDMKHIRANKDFFSVGGVSSFGMGISAQPSGASYFKDLLDVPTPTSSDLGHAWGIANISSDGTPTYGWIEAGTGGKTYTSADAYINIPTNGNTIGLNFNTLKTALDIPDVSGYGDIVTHDANEFLTQHQSLAEYVKSSELGNLAYLSSLSKSDVGLGNVENTALSTWTGSTKITTLGTITSGTWQGTAIADSYISSAAAWNGKYTKPSGGIPNSDLANSSMTLWGNSVSLGGTTNGAITIKNASGKYVTLEVDTDGNLKVSGTTGNMWATGGISAYQYGADTPELVAAFGDLTDVKASSPSAGQVWGYQGGKWQPITVQSGSTYTAGTGISISGTTISVKANTYADYGHNHDGDYLKEHQSLSAYLKVDGSNGTADGVSALINKLSEGDSTPKDNDYYVSQFVDGGTTNTTYYRRKMIKLWEYVKGKADSTYLGINANAASASKLNTASSYSAWGQTYWSNGVPQDISTDCVPTMPYLFFKKKPDEDGIAGFIGRGSNSSNNIQIDSYVNSNILIDSGGTSTKVGIGTTYPAYKLDVNGYSRLCNMIVNNSTTYNYLANDKAVVVIKTDDGNPYFGFKHSSTYWYLQGYTSRLMLGAGSGKSLYVDANGSVGIGLTAEKSINANAKLDVRGAIRIGNDTTGSLLEWKTDGTNSWLQINSSVVATGGIAAYSNVGSDTNLANLTLTNSLTVGNTIKTITPNDDDLTIEANILSLSAEVECPKGLTIGSGHQLKSLLINQTAETSKGTYYLHLKIGDSIYRLTAYKVS